MANGLTAEQPFPEGERFLEIVAATEESCARATLERIRQLGRRAPETHRRFGDLLSILYREACCAFGCPGGDHLGQRIAGRVLVPLPLGTELIERVANRRRSATEARF